MWYTRDRLVPGRVVLAQVGCCGQESFTLHSLLGHCCSSLRKHGAWGVAGGSVPVEEDPVVNSAQCGLVFTS